ncbi:unnamed protein product [marine sediment metagenome]|uniref:Uncharacterized protein n=1 Tax=marine sediment metagenome TaxID=412755 RepID=X1DZJ3_9ZZZZ
MGWFVSECLNPQWDVFVKYRKKFGHERFGLDWWIEQDFLNCLWIKRKFVLEKRKVLIKNVTNKYNYCPARDFLGEEEACRLIKIAYAERSVCVLHLKSSLKRMIYEGIFEEAVINYPKPESLDWMKFKG